MQCGEGARQLGKLILKNEEKWMRGWALWGLQMCVRVLSAEGKLEKGLCCYGEGQRHDHPSLSPALFSGHDGPRHLQQIDGQASRRPVIEINIKGLFLYRYFKCSQAQTRPRLLTLADYSFFLPITSCMRFQVAAGYLLTTATAGFPESCLFFQASGHYITPWFLGRPRVLVWGMGDPARRCRCLSDPASQSPQLSRQELPW